MEVTMASIIDQRPYQHHAQTMGVPSGVYWAAGVALVALALFLFFSSAASGPTTPVPLLDPSTVPPGLFMPLL
jgi:hypothetical protein